MNGECLSLQLAFDETTKSINQYRPPQSTKTCYTVSFTKHKNTKAYNRYILKKPYIEEFLDVMGTSIIEVCRVAICLARNYTNLYTVVGHEFNLGLCGIMSVLEAGAMWHDARLLDSQARVVLKHLRYHFKQKITVPFGKMYSLIDGYTNQK